ncbi:hypothetical protein HNR53_000456 [Bacillus benzoevorans]|uniref:Coupling factor for flagellin transcription and translation n=1 Tax=Bacillus benzoevorans TaxID=1456 RepID=A0A7X0HND0_9BACI|nr:hypothetical protein [Bacillus benzoevorans]
MNIIAMLAIVILFLRQNKLLQVEENQKKAIKEMELLINSYLLEMKDENEHFIREVKKIKDEKQNFSVESFSSKPVDLPLSHEPEVVHNSEMEKIELTREALDLSSQLEKTVSLQAVKAYQQHTQKKQEVSIPPQAIENKEQRKSILDMKQALSLAEKGKTKQTEALIQDSLLTQVLIMKKEGISEKEMAQKLKKGKTEIELLLKFRENK